MGAVPAVTEAEKVTGCPTFIDLARQGRSDRGRHRSPILAHMPQNGTLAPRCPGPAERFQEREAEFIEKRDVSAVALRLFLSGPILR